MSPPELHRRLSGLWTPGGAARPGEPPSPQGEDAQEALARMLTDPTPVTIQTVRRTLWAIGAHVQLACRHPANRGPLRQIAEEGVRDFRVFWQDDPALLALWEAGWDVAVDEPAPGRRGGPARRKGGKR